MTHIDRSFLNALRGALQTQVAAVLAATPELEALTVGSCRFDPTAGTFTFKLDGKMRGAPGADAVRYDQMRAYATHLPERGTAFRYGAAEYTVTGLNTRGTKVIATRSDGKAYLIPYDSFAKLYPRQA